MKAEIKIFIWLLIISIVFIIILFILKLLLGFSQEKFNETIMAGIFQTILSSLILYVVFDTVFVKRPKVRLVIESQKTSNDELILKFYLNNTGDLLAKNILLTAQFENLNILKIRDNKFKDISELRSHMPAIQFDGQSVLHAYPKVRNSYIGEVGFKIKDLKK